MIRTGMTKIRVVARLSLWALSMGRGKFTSAISCPRFHFRILPDHNSWFDGAAPFHPPRD